MVDCSWLRVIDCDGVADGESDNVSEALASFDSELLVLSVTDGCCEKLCDCVCEKLRESSSVKESELLPDLDNDCSFEKESVDDRLMLAERDKDSSLDEDCVVVGVSLDEKSSVGVFVLLIVSERLRRDDKLDVVLACAERLAESDVERDALDSLELEREEVSESDSLRGSEGESVKDSDLELGCVEVGVGTMVNVSVGMRESVSEVSLENDGVELRDADSDIEKDCDFDRLSSSLIVEVGDFVTLFSSEGVVERLSSNVGLSVNVLVLENTVVKVSVGDRASVTDELLEPVSSLEAESLNVTVPLSVTEGSDVSLDDALNVTDFCSVKVGDPVIVLEAESSGVVEIVEVGTFEYEMVSLNVRVVDASSLLDSVRLALLDGDKVTVIVMVPESERELVTSFVGESVTSSVGEAVGETLLVSSGVSDVEAETVTDSEALRREEMESVTVPEGVTLFDFESSSDDELDSESVGNVFDKRTRRELELVMSTLIVRVGSPLRDLETVSYSVGETDLDPGLLAVGVLTIVLESEWTVSVGGPTVIVRVPVTLCTSVVETLTELVRVSSPVTLVEMVLVSDKVTSFVSVNESDMLIVRISLSVVEPLTVSVIERVPTASL